MTSEELYIEFIDLVEENATNNNLDASKELFVSLYNSTSLQYLEWILEKRNEDAIRYVSPLLILKEKLQLESSKPTHDNYKLPEDFFDFSNLDVYAKTDCCDEDRLKTFEIKEDDELEIYYDKFNEPSFPYRETFYTLSNNNVAVFKKGFYISKVNLSYYRYPRQIDIEGYIRTDGTNSQNINPDLDDKVTKRILIATAKVFSANKGDSQGYQINSDRLFKSI